MNPLALPDPVSALTRQINGLHLQTITIMAGCLLLVFATMAFIVIRYRQSNTARKPPAFYRKVALACWVLVPAVMIGIDYMVAHRGSRLLRSIEDPAPADVTVKVVGSQWYWSYEYVDENIRFGSRFLELGTSDAGYLRRVDQPLVIPIHRRVRLLHASTDVIHSWWVPQVAVKRDAIPGYITETWTVVDREGDYYGQCAELCGTGHSSMPIHVKAVSPEEFARWVEQRQVERDAEIARLNVTWSREDLMARGEEVFLSYCATCHQKGGEGNPPFRPALKGSPIATGPVLRHLERVIFGSPGTDMAAWGERLTDAEIAAVITYERNAWGNNMNDLVQPADVREARQHEPVR